MSRQGGLLGDLACYFLQAEGSLGGLFSGQGAFEVGSTLPYSTVTGALFRGVRLTSE
jgi:hypothetical protein